MVSFGSRASRTLSPKRLNNIVTIKIANAGYSTTHGHCCIRLRPSESMLPHSAEEEPSPRKLRPEMLSIAPLKCRVPVTTTGRMAFGNI